MRELKLTAMWKTRVAAADHARIGETIEVRTLVAHPMESGFRLDSIGKPIPRDIITRFTAHYDGRQVFAANLFPAIAANPYLSFFVTATRSGTIELEWTDQHGNKSQASHTLTVNETS